MPVWPLSSCLRLLPLPAPLWSSAREANRSKKRESVDLRKTDPPVTCLCRSDASATLYRYGAARAGCTVFFIPAPETDRLRRNVRRGRRTKPSPVKDRRAQASAVKNRRVKASSVKRAYKSGLSEKTICRSGRREKGGIQSQPRRKKPWFRSICRDKPSHKRGRCENCRRRPVCAGAPAQTGRRRQRGVSCRNGKQTCRRRIGRSPSGEPLPAFP